jgi:hypothetical protein
MLLLGDFGVSRTLDDNQMAKTCIGTPYVSTLSLSFHLSIYLAFDGYLYLTHSPLHPLSLSVPFLP